MCFSFLFFFHIVFIINNLLHAMPCWFTLKPAFATRHANTKITTSSSAHGYSVYNAYASYNPVSRRDSELASLSSGRTDSDTMSISSMSTWVEVFLSLFSFAILLSSTWNFLSANYLTINFSLDSDGRPQRRHHHHHQSSLERKMIRANVAANNEIGSLAVSSLEQPVSCAIINRNSFIR